VLLAVLVRPPDAPFRSMVLRPRLGKSCSTLEAIHRDLLGNDRFPSRRAQGLEYPIGRHRANTATGRAFWSDSTLKNPVK